MDIGLFRGLVTAVLFVLFIGLWVWVFSKKRHAEYEAASRLPLDDEDGDDRPAACGEREQSE